MIRHLAGLFFVFLGADVFSAADVEARARLVVRAAGVQGNPLSARLTVLSVEGKIAAAGFFRGTIERDLDPGSYGVIVSRGPTHTVFDEEVTLEAGRKLERTAVLEPVLDLAGLVSVDPLYEKGSGGENPLSVEAEDLQVALSPAILGEGVVRRPRGLGGAFAEGKLCPFTGVPSRAEVLQGVWGVVVGETDRQAGWWAPLGAWDAVRFDWFHLLARGRRVSALGGSGAGPFPGLPRMYIPERAKADPLSALKAGEGSLSWGILVQVWAGRELPGKLVRTRFGGVELRVKIQAAPWVKTDEVTIFSGGQAVMRSDLRPAQGVVRLDRTYFLRPRRDTFYVVAASASESLLAYRPLEVKPLGIAGPVWVDADGDGRWTPAQDLARERLRRYDGFPAAALTALDSEPLRVKVQAAAESRDPVLLDHLADDISPAVRLAVLSALGRNRPPWAADILDRRSVKCDRDPLEFSVLLASMVRCGKTTVFERFERRFSRWPIAYKERAFLSLVHGGVGRSPLLWHVLGPFADPDRVGIRGRYGPENGAVPGQRFRDFRGKTPQWSEVRPENGILSFEADGEAGVYFAFSRFTVRRGSEVAFLLGNRDGIALWIDGEKAGERVGREARSIFLLRYVDRGEHRLLLEISRRRGRARTVFRVLDPKGVFSFEGG